MDTYTIFCKSELYNNPFFYTIKNIHEFNLFHIAIFLALFGLILLLINTHHRNGTFYSLDAFVLGLTNITCK
jgi:hypothetical protein